VTRGRDALPAAWRHDRLVLELGPALADASVHGDDVAMAIVRPTRSGDPAVDVYGEPAAATAILGRLVDDGTLRAPLRWMTVPADADVPDAVQEALVVTALPGWDWLVADGLTEPTDTEELVVRLDAGRDAAAIRACLAEANPGTEANPSGPDEAGWWGVPGPDGLIGVIGAGLRGGREPGGEAWHLHGLGVVPSARRRGLGAALTARATRDGLAAGADWVSLGMWAANDEARRVYHRLGFVTAHRRRSLRPGDETPPGD
jgi:ribosomal protein S18 acetylase RimI-like enzyme